MQKKVIKVNFGLIQDGLQQANELIDLAKELKGNKTDIKTTMRRIEGLAQDGIANFKSLQNIINRIESVNKEMGITSKVPQLQQMEKALQLWSDANSLKI